MTPMEALRAAWGRVRTGQWERASSLTQQAVDRALSEGDDLAIEVGRRLASSLAHLRCAGAVLEREDAPEGRELTSLLSAVESWQEAKACWLKTRSKNDFRVMVDWEHRLWKLTQALRKEVA